MCKADQKQLNNFNISVGITEKFMEAVEKDHEYDLINPAAKRSAAPSMPARCSPHRQAGMGERRAGIIFLDRLNRDNQHR